MKLSTKLIFLLLALMLPSTAIASFKLDGIYYEINDDRASVTVTRDKYDKYRGDISIPSTINYNGTEYLVTAIGPEAFSECSGLISVSIPNTVTDIGFNSFYKCSSLTSIIIPNSVITVDSWAFERCTSLASITIGNSIASINSDAFSGCNHLNEVRINDITAW